MICSRCQSENLPSAKFCDECGAPFESPCVNCGAANRRSAKFCQSCGVALNQELAAPSPQAAPAAGQYVPKHLAEKIRATQHALEGERKQVTVLFADIRGSTQWLDGVDPEEAQRIIDPVLHIMMEAVHRYEGTVNQVLGDGIMALFGAPVAHEDHALRACYAALAMQDEMRQHRHKLGQSDDAGLRIGIGLNTGEVVVRSIDTELNLDYSALGQTTHLAARMQEIAKPNSVLLTAATLRQVEGYVEVDDLGMVQAKGFAQAVQAYRLIAATHARTRLHAAVSRGLSGFVSRQRELDDFRRALELASAGEGQILALVGEAGLGKSRLIYEFTHHHLSAGHKVVEGTSASYGKATPYYPLIELLRRYFQVDDGEAADSAMAKIAQRIHQLDGGLDETLPVFLTLLDVLPKRADPAGNRQELWVLDALKKFRGLEPQQRRRATLDALKRLMVVESRIQPLVLVMEDLHWIDSETQAFLDGLIGALPLAKILLIVSYRPGYSHSWADKNCFNQLRVNPLPATGAAELLQLLLGNDGSLSPLKELLIKRSDGNPFFIEESVRSLVETGILTGAKGAYRPGLSMDSITIPSTVQTVVAGRIDRMGQEDKELLQMAAVIGVNVPLRLLRAVANLPEERLQKSLSHLQAAEFLYETSLFPELEYTFKHALTNEVAYGALLRERRISLHARIVSALESQGKSGPHDHLEKLAHHAFHGELWSQAVGYLKEAGDRATAQSSFRNALTHFERALEALHHLPKTPAHLRQAIDLRFDARNSLFLLNDFRRGLEYLEEARTIAVELNDEERLGQLLTWMTAHWNLAGNSEQAIVTGAQAIEHTTGPSTLDANIVSRYFLGIANYNLGRYKTAIDELKIALRRIPKARQFERFGTTGILAVLCKTWLLRSLAQIGQFDETRRYGEEALATAMERDHPFSIVYACYANGAVAVLHGEFAQAIAILERGLKVCDAAEIPVQRPLLVSCLAVANAFVGRLDVALALLERGNDANHAVLAVDKGQAPLGKALSTVWDVQTLILTGQLGEAEMLAQQGLNFFRDGKDRGSEAWLRYLQGEIFSHGDGSQSARALASYGEAAALAEELGMRPLRAHCQAGLARLRAQANQPEGARAQYFAVAEQFRTMGAPFWAAESERAGAAIGS